MYRSDKLVDEGIVDISPIFLKSLALRFLHSHRKPAISYTQTILKLESRHVMKFSNVKFSNET